MQGRAAGQDMITREIANIETQAHTQAALDAMNEFLARGKFMEDMHSSLTFLMTS